LTDICRSGKPWDCQNFSWTQAGFHRHTAFVARVHLAGEEPADSPPCLLGQIHGRIRILDKRGNASAIVRVEANTYACADEDFTTVDLKSLLQGSDDLLCNDARRARPANIR